MPVPRRNTNIFHVMSRLPIQVSSRSARLRSHIIVQSGHSHSHVCCKKQHAFLFLIWSCTREDLVRTGEDITLYQYFLYRARCFSTLPPGLKSILAQTYHNWAWVICNNLVSS